MDERLVSPDVALEIAVLDLEEAAEGLTRGILGLDGGRVQCGGLSGHYADFAGRMGADYPSLAAPAGRLSELFADLDAALGRLSATTEGLLVCADRMLAEVRAAAAGR